MSIILRLAWRNLWRQPRRTWLTTGAMVFSNVLLVFMISLQFGMYGLMVNNGLKAFTGHIQVQAPGFIDDAFATVDNATGKMNRLLAQLRKDRGGQQRSQTLELAQVLRDVARAKEGTRPSLTLELPQTPVHVVALPFYDAEKNIPRGLASPDALEPETCCHD